MSVAVFSRGGFCRLTFLKVICLPTVLSSLSDVCVSTTAPYYFFKTLDPCYSRHYMKHGSVVLQGVADAKGRFIHVSTGYAGSIHDARVLRMSSLLDKVENGRILVSPVLLTGHY